MAPCLDAAVATVEAAIPVIEAFVHVPKPGPPFDLVRGLPVVRVLHVGDRLEDGVHRPRTAGPQRPGPVQQRYGRYLLQLAELSFRAAITEALLQRDAVTTETAAPASAKPMGATSATPGTACSAYRRCQS
jgi:hypothetical protein